MMLMLQMACTEQLIELPMTTQEEHHRSPAFLVFFSNKGTQFDSHLPASTAVPQHKTEIAPSAQEASWHAVMKPASPNLS